MKIIGSYKEVRQRLLGLTRKTARRVKIALTSVNVIKLVDEFEAEVNNGGIDQFFFNSTGDYALETVQALEIVKANKTAEILREACDRFPDGSPPTDIYIRRNLMLSTVNPNADEFDELDKRFFEYEDNLYKLLDEYKRSTT
jgi:hypothetical protein